MEASTVKIDENVVCVICRRQFSKYTCPRCNIPYCSLTCFRSTTHANCSEGFYKKELEADIRTTPSKSAEERKQMMELLKRFEDDSLDSSGIIDELANENDDGDDDFLSRFRDLDLENITHEQLWSALNPEERDRFMKALGDPSSELTQQLLASDELDKQRIEPWWDAPDPSIQTETEYETDENSSLRPHTAAKNYGVKPQLIDIPEAVISASSKSLNQGPSLLYNVAATLIVYAYISRFFAISPLTSIKPEDPDFIEARRILSQLLPFLVDKKSTTVLPNLSALITDLWSRFEPESMTSAFFSILLNDASRLLRPKAVTVLSPHPSSTNTSSPYESHPNTTSLLALSDLSVFFSTPLPVNARSAKSTNSKPHQTNTHVTHKVAFYAARIISTPSNVLSTLADELMLRAEVVRREGMSETGRGNEDPKRRMIELSETERKVVQLPKSEGGREAKPIVIEELT
ncbi:hypothetical protein QCA50_008852 [Cerrena zonata]|uniref:HIT-type domain-containing protein n=1 Tax=Cerrena zonata TaxID=2478898 RepID=A0AAW0G5H2_9APHY